MSEPRTAPDPGSRRPPDPGPEAGPVHPRVRTFHARHGRVTASMRHTLETSGPRHALAGRTGPRPLVLEVGCGSGDAALAFADAHPDLDVLAVDVHTPGVVHLLRRLEEEPRPNVRVERADALALLDDDVGSGELAGVHVFFPDPWPKARHHKRRFIRPDVADLLADRMRPGADLLVATDDDDYTRAAIAVLGSHPAFRGGPTARPRWRPRSGYEAKAGAAGRSVIDLAYRRA